MTIAEKIHSLRIQNGMTQEELARRLNTTKQTISKYEKGIVSNLPLSRVSELAKALGTTSAYLTGWEDTHKEKAPSVSNEATSISKQYDYLDEHGKRVVRAVIKEETARMEAAAEREDDNVVEMPKRSVPLFANAFAAGPAEPDFGNLWETIEVDAKQKGDFAIKINGDSMEPYLHDGQIAFGVKQTPKVGEVGAFLLDGEFLCKQYVDDCFGNVYLLSLNRDREDCDVTVWRSANRSLICFGKILISKKLPRP